MFDPGTVTTTIRLLRALAIAAAGGGLFAWLDFPAPWIAGGTIATATASLLGVPMAMPARVRDVLFVLLGISMGAGVSPETVQRLPDWPVSLFLVAVSVVAITGGVYVWFRKVAGWDWATALMASVPGALSYVMAVAIESGADLRRVAIAQSLRVIILVAVLPFLIVGLTPAPIVAPRLPAAASLADLAILVAAGTAAGLAAQAIRIPAGLLTGAFVASALVHGAGVVEANLPLWLLIPSFLGIAVVIGVRFAGTDMALLKATVAVSLGGFLVGSAIALACAGLTVAAIAIGWGQAALAFAPGGLEAMTALSYALALDPAYVASHQLFRFMGIALLLPGVFAAIERRSRGPRD